MNELKNDRGVEEEKEKGGIERGERTEGRSTGAAQARSGREEEPGEGKSRPESKVCALVFCYFWTLLKTINFFFFFFEEEVAQGAVISLS